MHAADADHPSADLARKLEAIYGLRSADVPRIDLTLRRPYLDLLEELGRPQDHLPPVIHVAGTNGKGSVIAMLRGIFETSGFAVHVYTSPHLIRFNERIVLAGREIGDALLESLLDEVMAKNAGGSLTFFEITTALALTAFARAGADVLLLETGLGGRLDCTNVIENPAATVITRIGYDHMEFLGEALEQIAAEKAGIMKKGVPCIAAPQDSETVYEVLERMAAATGCSLHRARAVDDPPTNLVGAHQRGNAGAALFCLAHLPGFSFSPEQIKAGLAAVRWPGRLQRLSWSGMPQGCELWIDGGHNENAARALCAQAALWAQEDGKPLHLVIGMMPHKDIRTFVRLLAPVCAGMVQVAVDDGDAAREAVRGIFRRAEKPVRVLCTGSLYLMRHFLEQDGDASFTGA